MTEHLARKLTVLNAYGMNARPCALIVKNVSKHAASDTEVSVSNGEIKVSGKSIMGLLTLEGHQGRELYCEAHGPGARAALEAMTQLFNDGFNADEPRLSRPASHSEWIVLDREASAPEAPLPEEPG